jgi:hypothetical protein
MYDMDRCYEWEAVAQGIDMRGAHLTSVAVAAGRAAEPGCEVV